MRTFHLSGNVDHRNSGSARTQMLGELLPKASLAIDLSGVTYIDSAGLAVLVQVHWQAKKFGCDVHLTNVSEGVSKRFRLAHLDGVFNIVEADRPTIH